MTFFTVLIQMLSLVIIIGAGFWAGRAGMLDDHSAHHLSALIMNIFNPMLVLSSAVEAAGEIPLSRLGNVALVALVMFGFFIVVGRLTAPLFDRDHQQQALIQLMFVFSNLGFIGIPVVSSILGPEYIVYVTEFIILYNLLLYTYGVALMEGRFSLASLRSMLNFGNAMSITAIVLVVAGIHMPQFLATAVVYLGNAASPLALVAVGYSLSVSDLRQIFGDKRLYVFSALKLLLLPLILLPAARLLLTDQTLVPLCLVLFGMPIGNMPLIISTEKGVNGALCSAGIIMTTLLCVLTIPILMTFV